MKKLRINLITDLNRSTEIHSDPEQTGYSVRLYRNSQPSSYRDNGKIAEVLNVKLLGHEATLGCYFSIESSMIIWAARRAKNRWNYGWRTEWYLLMELRRFAIGQNLKESVAKFEGICWTYKIWAYGSKVPNFRGNHIT